FHQFRFTECTLRFLVRWWRPAADEDTPAVLGLAAEVYRQPIVAKPGGKFVGFGAHRLHVGWPGELRRLGELDGVGDREIGRRLRLSLWGLHQSFLSVVQIVIVGG